MGWSRTQWSVNQWNTGLVTKTGGHKLATFTYYNDQGVGVYIRGITVSNLGTLASGETLRNSGGDYYSGTGSCPVALVNPSDQRLTGTLTACFTPKGGSSQYLEATGTVTLSGNIFVSAGSTMTFYLGPNDSSNPLGSTSGPIFATGASGSVSGFTYALQGSPSAPSVPSVSSPIYFDGTYTMTSSVSTNQYSYRDVNGQWQDWQNFGSASYNGSAWERSGVKWRSYVTDSRYTTSTSYSDVVAVAYTLNTPGAPTTSSPTGPVLYGNYVTLVPSNNPNPSDVTLSYQWKPSSSSTWTSSSTYTAICQSQDYRVMASRGYFNPSAYSPSLTIECKLNKPGISLSKSEVTLGETILVYASDDKSTVKSGPSTTRTYVCEKRSVGSTSWITHEEVSVTGASVPFTVDTPFTATEYRFYEKGEGYVTSDYSETASITPKVPTPVLGLTDYRSGATSGAPGEVYGAYANVGSPVGVKVLNTVSSVPVTYTVNIADGTGSGVSFTLTTSGESEPSGGYVLGSIVAEFGKRLDGQSFTWTKDSRYPNDLGCTMKADFYLTATRPGCTPSDAATTPILQFLTQPYNIWSSTSQRLPSIKRKDSLGVHDLEEDEMIVPTNNILVSWTHLPLTEYRGVFNFLKLELVNADSGAIAWNDQISVSTSQPGAYEIVLNDLLTSGVISAGTTYQVVLQAYYCDDPSTGSTAGVDTPVTGAYYSGVPFKVGGYPRAKVIYPDLGQHDHVSDIFANPDFWYNTGTMKGKIPFVVQVGTDYKDFGDEVKSVTVQVNSESVEFAIPSTDISKYTTRQLDNGDYLVVINADATPSLSLGSNNILVTCTNSYGLQNPRDRLISTGPGKGYCEGVVTRYDYKDYLVHSEALISRVQLDSLREPADHILNSYAGIVEVEGYVDFRTYYNHFRSVSQNSVVSTKEFVDLLRIIKQIYYTMVAKGYFKSRSGLPSYTHQDYEVIKAVDPVTSTESDKYQGNYFNEIIAYLKEYL